MTLEIILVFIILGSALLLFFTGWLRMDIVSLLVLALLAFTGIITPAEALAGFSNPAVVTVWAMFILSAALYQTGVARIIGRKVLQLSGSGEGRLTALIMLSAGLMSAFMNNVGVVALMLPVVMDMARAKGIPPSRLLLPLAYGAMLGGLTTLIGTPPNLLISYALEDAGETPFRLFDYTPIGFAALLAGVIFMTFIGRHLLPRRDAISETKKHSARMSAASYKLQERSFILKVRPASPLVGKTLSESRLRAALGLNVLAIIREGTTLLDPGPDTLIRSNDKLHVQGRIENLKAMQHWEVIPPEDAGLEVKALLRINLQIVEAKIGETSSLKGKRLQETNFRKRLGVNVLAVRRADQLKRMMLHDVILQKNDVLLLQGPRDRLEVLEKEGKITEIREADEQTLIEKYRLHEMLFIMKVSEEAKLLERTIAGSQIGSAFGMTAIGTFHQDGKLEPYAPGTTVNAGDRLLVKGNIHDLPLLQGLKELDIPEDPVPEIQKLESEDIQMAEVVLAPRSLLAGKTLREINFRQKYGLTVVAIWREGEIHKTNLHNMPLEFGEALLLYGKRSKLELIDSEPDFILLTQLDKQPQRTGKALTSALVMLGILIPVLLGVVPLAIAAVAGIALMVLTGCLKMEEAYRAIEWRAVFLIAGMLPLGTAMQQTGAASLAAEGVVNVFGYFGPWGVIAGLYLLTATLTIAIHPAALVVIMSPIALETAAGFGISPQSLMMTVAIAAAAVFMSPVSHAANLLVMGPGGYRFTDYLKVGLPMTLVVMAVAMLLLPHIWPL